MTLFPELVDSVPLDLRPEVERLVRPSVRLHRSKPQRAPSSTQSYVGGYPFVPMDHDLPWPVDGEGNPMVHLLQVNFAELPVLPGFPTSGVLQWFCSADDCYGLTFNGPGQGRAGLVARWWSVEDLSRPVLHTPYAPIPTLVREYLDESPLATPGPVAVEFVLAPSLPSHGDESVDLSEEWMGAQYNQLLPGPESCHVGGYPNFAQGDPRARFPDRARTLLVNLDQEDLFFWGDAGSAQLFGDPAGLARGDVSSLWWDWACA